MNATNGGTLDPQGHASHQITRDLGPLTHGQVKRVGLLYHLANWASHRRRDLPRLAAARMLGRVSGLIRVESALAGVTYRRPEGLAPWQVQRIREWLEANQPLVDLPRHFGGEALDFGTLSTRVVTNAGVGYIVDAFQNLVELENMKYHGYGTGTNAEAAGDSALQTELTTQYNPDSTRPTGTQTENAANIYETVATLSPDTGGTLAITEHGIFSATSAGVLLDRSVFSAINIVAGTDSLQTTYRFTVTAGS